MDFMPKRLARVSPLRQMWEACRSICGEWRKLPKARIFASAHRRRRRYVLVCVNVAAQLQERRMRCPRKLTLG